ncbi:MAG: hypothetical protein IJ544_01340 [Prevotella sp.]|nr:hypothetical protein [Prevotella sp.]
MKKLMMMALMAAAATTAFAQDALVKEAKKLAGKGDFAEAVKVITPALTSSETLDKAAAWHQYSDIFYAQHSGIAEAAAKSAITHEAYDTLTMYNAAIKAWETALKCDEFDLQPNEKGKVKPRFRNEAQNRYKIFGVQLVQAGQFFYQHKDNDNALKAWKLYCDMKNTPIFAEVQDFPKDPFFYDITYYTAFLSYQTKDYDNAVKYAQLTAENPEKVEDANEILLFAKKDNMQTKEDSVSYVAMVKDLHKAHPDQERYFNLLMDYYSHANNPVAMNEWLNEESQINPQNSMVWALMGENKMNEEKWDEAIALYDKAIEVKPDFVQCIFNAGRCYYSSAMELQNKLADKNGMITNENRNKVVEVVKKAEGYYVRAKELDPDRAACNWAYPLYQIYYFLKDNDKMKEIEAVDPSLAQ